MHKSLSQAPRLIRVSTTRLDGGLVFGSTPKVIWEAFAIPDRQNRVAIGNYSMLVDHPDGKILVNTGPGDKTPIDISIAPVRSRSCLLRELRESDISPKDIALVIQTHLHDEYAGGATHMTSSGRVVPTFSNARYIVQKADYLTASSPSERSKKLYRSDDFLPLEETNQLELIEGSAEIAKGVFVESAPGPTPGHQVVKIEQGEDTFVFLGSLAATSMHIKPSVNMTFDWDPDITLESKRSVFSNALLANAYLAPLGGDEWVRAKDAVSSIEANSSGEMTVLSPKKVAALAAAG